MTKTMDLVGRRHITPDHARRLLESNVTPRANSIICRVETTSQSVNSGVRTLVSFSTEVWDTDTMWSSGAATKIYARRRGLYLLLLQVRFENNTTGYREHLFYKNGVRIHHEERKDNDNWHHYGSMRIIRMDKDDYVEIYLGQGSGSTLTNTVFFSMARIAL